MEPQMTDAVAFEVWLRSAEGWAEASLSLVDAATDLTTRSRDLADLVEADKPVHPHLGKIGGNDGLPAELRELAGAIERDTREHRDRYLTTAAELEQYREILD
jgi:hypothetical protein